MAGKRMLFAFVLVVLLSYAPGAQAAQIDITGTDIEKVYYSMSLPMCVP